MISYRNDTLVAKKYYIAGYEYTDSVEANRKKEVTYISAPTGLVSANVKIGTVNNYYYVLTDHLGSITRLLDSNGYNITLAQFTYDAWGRLRNVKDTNNMYDIDSLLPYFHILDRGYTGHEHLLDHDIINMNGRIYDPVVGQFMQADNYIQTPEDYIGYNRYAYCRYNPFKYTDPSGEMYAEKYAEGGPINDGGGCCLMPDNTEAMMNSIISFSANMQARAIFEMSGFFGNGSSGGAGGGGWFSKFIKKIINAVFGGSDSEGDTETSTDQQPETDAEDETTAITFTDNKTGETRTYNVPAGDVEVFKEMIEKYGTLPSYEDMVEIDDDKNIDPWEPGDKRRYEVPAILDDDSGLIPGDAEFTQTENITSCTREFIEILTIARSRNACISWWIHTQTISYEPSDPDRATNYELSKRYPDVRGIIKNSSAYIFFDSSKDHYLLPRGFYKWEVK